MKPWVFAIFVSAILSVGCEEKMVVPPPPPNTEPFIPGLPSGQVRPTPEDGGIRDARVDGSEDPPCTVDGTVDRDNLISVTGTDLVNLNADQVFTTWNPDTCDELSRQLALASVADKCSETPKQLTILVDDGLLGTAIPVGAPVSLETTGLIIVYTESGPLGAESWVSTCPGSEGSVIFQEFGTEAGDTFRVAVDATLTNCRGSQAPIQLRSTTIVPLFAPADEVCAR